MPMSSSLRSQMCHQQPVTQQHQAIQDHTDGHWHLADLISSTGLLSLASFASGTRSIDRPARSAAAMTANGGEAGG